MPKPEDIARNEMERSVEDQHRLEEIEAMLKAENIHPGDTIWLTATYPRFDGHDGGIVRFDGIEGNALIICEENPVTKKFLDPRKIAFDSIAKLSKMHY